MYPSSVLSKVSISVLPQQYTSQELIAFGPICGRCEISDRGQLAFERSLPFFGGSLMYA